MENNQEERWKPMLGWEGLYEVSNLGAVRSLTRTVGCSGGSVRVVKGRQLKPFYDKEGYLEVSPCRNNQRTHGKIHQLVWRAFNGEIPVGYEIHHKNSKRDDNRLVNLIVVTRHEHMTKPIYWLLKDGTIAGWFCSAAEAARTLRLNLCAINHVLTGKAQTSGNYRFCYVGEEHSLSPLSPYTANAKSVDAYHVSGEYVGRFPAMTAAANALNVELWAVSHVCRGTLRQVDGYRFYYAGSPQTLLPIPKYKKSAISVDAFNLSGTFLRRFEAITEAAEVLAVPATDIVKVCRGKKKTAKGYKFKYADK